MTNQLAIVHVNLCVIFPEDTHVLMLKSPPCTHCLSIVHTTCECVHTTCECVVRHAASVSILVYWHVYNKVVRVIAKSNSEDLQPLNPEN